MANGPTKSRDVAGEVAEGDETRRNIDEDRCEKKLGERAGLGGGLCWTAIGGEYADRER